MSGLLDYAPRKSIANSNRNLIKHTICHLYLLKQFDEKLQQFLHVKNCENTNFIISGVHN